MATIQRFEIGEEIGRGAMGVVYRARDPLLDRDVAIKVLGAPLAPALPAGLDGGPATIDLRAAPTGGDARFAEARLMARLNHPNVLAVYEVGVHEERVFLVTELVTGASLRAFLAAPHSRAERARVLALAARGLAAAHGQGVVHRDFKPDNVLLGDDGRVRVCDFGIAGLVQPERRSLERVGDALGTPRYMAPEVQAGGEATVASDVFAACRTIGDALGDEAPAALAALVAAGLAEAPTARPALGAIIAALDAAASPPIRRARWPWLVAGAAALALGAFGVQHARRGAAPCDGDPARTLGGEGPERRAALRARLAAAFDAATADRVLALYAQRAADLAAAGAAACRARDAGDPTAAARAACVGRRALELGAAASRQRAVTAPTAALALAAAWPLADASACSEPATAPLPAPSAALAAAYLDAAALDPMFPTPAQAPAAAALAQRAAALGDHELEGWASAELGLVQRRAGAFEAAEQALQRAYAIATEIRSTPLQAFVLAERSRVALFRGDPVAALEVAHLALALVTAPTLGPLLRARIYYTVGVTEKVQSDIPAALAHLDQGLALFRAPGVVAPGLELSLLDAKADALLVLAARAAEAEATARTALARARSELAETHPAFDGAVSELATVLDVRGDYAGALALHREELARVQRTAPDPLAQAVIEARISIAADLSELGQISDARAELAQLDALCAGAANLRWLRPTVQRELGVALFESGDIGGGLHGLAQAVASASAVFGADKLETLEARRQLAELQLEAGRGEDAARDLAELAAALAAHSHPDDALFVRAGYASDAALLAGDAPRAEALARAGLAAPDGPLVPGVELGLALRLGRSLLAQRRFADAAAPLARADELAAHEREDRRAEITVERARALIGAGHVREGRELARAAAPVLARYPGRLRARAALAALGSE